MKHALKELQKYCEDKTSKHSTIIHELERESNLKTLNPAMISGPYQGKLLNLLSKMIRPKAILEIGSYTGYSALCMAEGLAENGVLHTIEVNLELEYLIRKYIAKAGLKDQVILHMGDAEVIVPKIDLAFDLAFIDAGKHDYINHYELVIDKMTKGGIILADNVLWFGKVLDQKKNKDTQMLDNFNLMVHDDPRVENIMLPIRDGLYVIRKI